MVRRKKIKRKALFLLTVVILAILVLGLVWGFRFRYKDVNATKLGDIGDVSLVVEFEQFRYPLFAHWEYGGQVISVVWMYGILDVNAKDVTPSVVVYMDTKSIASPVDPVTIAYTTTVLSTSFKVTWTIHASYPIASWASKYMHTTTSYGTSTLYRVIPYLHAYVAYVPLGVSLGTHQSTVVTGDYGVYYIYDPSLGVTPSVSVEFSAFKPENISVVGFTSEYMIIVVALVAVAIYLIMRK